MVRAEPRIMPTGPPHFIIIGAGKSGTTSLYRYVTEHPQVAGARTKQVDYFDVNYLRGDGWYREQFPEDCQGETLSGEASPYYMVHPHAPGRIRRLAPDVKLIAILRNPVDRTYSHYQHQVRSGRETLSFEDALKREEDRVVGELEKMLADESYNSRAHRRFSYLTRSRYNEHLERWFALFPLEQMLVIESEVMFERPHATTCAVFEFLGLPPRLPDRFGRYMPGSYVEPMRPETRDRLVAYFYPFNQRLYRLLDRTFSWDR